MVLYFSSVSPIHFSFPFFLFRFLFLGICIRMLAHACMYAFVCILICIRMQCNAAVVHEWNYAQKQRVVFYVLVYVLSHKHTRDESILPSSLPPQTSSSVSSSSSSPSAAAAAAGSSSSSSSSSASSALSSSQQLRLNARAFIAHHILNPRYYHGAGLASSSASSSSAPSSASSSSASSTAATAAAAPFFLPRSSPDVDCHQMSSGFYVTRPVREPSPQDPSKVRVRRGVAQSHAICAARPAGRRCVCVCVSVSFYFIFILYFVSLCFRAHRAGDRKKTARQLKSDCTAVLFFFQVVVSMKRVGALETPSFKQADAEQKVHSPPAPSPASFLLSFTFLS